MDDATTYDFVLVGGGLQSALIALAVRHHRPSARVLIVEQAEALGGNHTWCFHDGDAPAATLAWLAPLVEHSWPDYEVRFPGQSRVLRHTYRCVTSAGLNALLQRHAATDARLTLRTGARATGVTGTEVVLASGERLRAGVVVDARGPLLPMERGLAGYQKFVGVEVRLPAARAPSRPIVIDAAVPQTDGLRFVYSLPLAADRVLVEDTYFSDSPVLDRDQIRRQALAYVAEQGWGTAAEIAVAREESGVLPLPLTFDGPDGQSAPLVAGYAGGWFHPTTGYSFPAAVRLAEHLATTPPSERFGAAWRRHVAHQRAQVAYCVWLNRLLFRAVAPEQRWQIFARFYRLSEDLIRRFYALELTRSDMARIVVGRPPPGVSLRGLWDAARISGEAPV